MTGFRIVGRDRDMRKKCSPNRALGYIHFSNISLLRPTPLIICELPRKLTLDEPCLTLFGEKP